MTSEFDEWDLEWDRMAHTPYEYQQEIKQLRQRCMEYAKQVEQLEKEAAIGRKVIELAGTVWSKTSSP